MYYPKSQITSNLYTNGNEFVTEDTLTSYIGYYFKTSNGKFYTGRNPSDRPNTELIPTNLEFSSEDIFNTNNAPEVALIISSDNPNAFEFVTNFNVNTIITYLNTKNINPYNPPVQFVPYYSPVTPTTQDYQIKEFRRYFCKKTNELIYIEINQQQYKQLVSKDPQILWQLYEPFFIDWQISGDKQQVIKTNRNSVDLLVLRQKFIGLNEYLKKDYSKYYQ
jgi:hypothetical protein